MRRKLRDVGAEPARWGEMPDAGPAPVVWVHAGAGVPRAALDLLRAQVAEADPDIAFALTREPDHPEPALAPPVPDEHPGFAAALLDRWRPAALVWAGQPVRPILLTAAGARGLRPVIAGGPMPADVERAGRAQSRLALGSARIALAGGYSQAEALRRAGVPASRIEVVGPLQSNAGALPIDEPHHEALSRALAGRPVWLAAGVPRDMIGDILEAQIELRRRTHRAILVLEAENPPEGPGIVAEHDMPGPEDAVLAVRPGRRGLWARLAQVTVLVGTLRGAEMDTLVPAAVGSAVIHGGPPGRLDAAGGAVRIGNAAQVVAAVEDLLAPDRAAILARAGWEVATEGAEATVRLAQAILDAVDDAPPGTA